MVLASYARFSFAEGEGRTAAVRALDTVALAAAHCMPAIPFAGALSSSPGAIPFAGALLSSPGALVKLENVCIRISSAPRQLCM